MLHQDAVPPTCPIFYWKYDPGPSVQLGCGIAHSMQVLIMQRESHGTAPQQARESMDTAQPGCVDVEQQAVMDKV